jgi:hypothetical protein
VAGASPRGLEGHLPHALRDLGIGVHIWPMPVELPDPIRFTEDHTGAYDAEAAHRCWRVLLAANSVLKRFRAGFIGKCSPVHFFWGASTWR